MKNFKCQDLPDSESISKKIAELVQTLGTLPLELELPLILTGIFTIEPFLNNRGASPKSGDIAFGARAALDFNGNFHYVAIFEKTVESQRNIFNGIFFRNQLFRCKIRFETF